MAEPHKRLLARDCPKRQPPPPPTPQLSCPLLILQAKCKQIHKKLKNDLENSKPMDKSGFLDQW